MKYEGYFGEVTYDDEAKIFHGEVIGLKDIITFQAKSVDELKKAFQDSINDYLAWRHECNEQQ
jgi:predicted HicB family RNase H-like nuclease